MPFAPGKDPFLDQLLDLSVFLDLHDLVIDDSFHARQRHDHRAAILQRELNRVFVDQLERGDLHGPAVGEESNARARRESGRCKDGSDQEPLHGRRRDNLTTGQPMPGDGIDRTFSSIWPVKRACRSASWICPSGRASSVRSADPPRSPAGAWRRSDAARGARCAR